MERTLVCCRGIKVEGHEENEAPCEITRRERFNSLLYDDFPRDELIIK